MTTIVEIEKAISKLSKKDMLEFRKRFIQHDNRKWDKEIINDVESGLLDDLIQEAKDDYDSGKYEEV